MNIADLRKDYKRATLDPSQCDPDPLLQFDRWLRQAIDAQVPEPTAMTLATVGEEGRPSARIVLLKGLQEERFVFFTNYQSRKGRELAARQDAALLFFWPELERQIRIEGRVAKIDAGASDDYYRSRPLPSRFGAWASPQSDVVADRAELETRIEAFNKRYGEDPPRPAHWGGYALQPHLLEFWQGRPDRLHDRVRYRLDAASWRIERLAP